MTVILTVFKTSTAGALKLLKEVNIYIYITQIILHVYIDYLKLLEMNYVLHTKSISVTMAMDNTY